VTAVADWLLGHDRTAPAKARRAVESWADTQALTEDTLDDLLLVVNEIVTDAHQRTSGPVALQVETDGDAITVRVSCVETAAGAASRQSRARPVRGRRRLLIVHAVCDAWGVRRRAGGRTVWAQLPRR
jgi:hypothetical protein